MVPFDLTNICPSSNKADRIVEKAGTIKTNSYHGYKRFSQWTDSHLQECCVYIMQGITNSSCSLIDHGNTNQVDMYPTHGAISLRFSDHKLIYMSHKNERHTVSYISCHNYIDSGDVAAVGSGGYLPEFKVDSCSC